jgi:hypothetical protein
LKGAVDVYEHLKRTLVGALSETLTQAEMFNIWQALSYGKGVMVGRKYDVDGIDDVIQAIEESAGGAGALLAQEGENFRRDIEAETTGHVMDREEALALEHEAAHFGYDDDGE